MIIAVTNRKICKGGFLERIAEIAKARPSGIILREKDLEPESYEELAVMCKQICARHNVPLIIHTHIGVAKNMGIECLHLPMYAYSKHHKAAFKHVGVSVHSEEEGKLAESMGASYLIAGHIFPTDCKKSMPHRGTGFLKQLCSHAAVPVFAIGGITKDNLSEIRGCGAAGICIMSEFMMCKDPFESVNRYHRLMKQFCQS